MLSPRSIAVQGFGYGPRHIGLQGLVPFEAGEGALAGSRRRGSLLEDLYPPRRRRPREEPAPALPVVLSGEDLAELLASAAPFTTAPALLAAAARFGASEDLFLRSLGIPRQRLEALFDARGPELAEDSTLLPRLLALAASDRRTRLALLLAVALLMWD